MNLKECTALAITLVAISDPGEARATIRTLHKTEWGAEMLRQIVRDDLAGAGDIIANALWVNS